MFQLRLLGGFSLTDGITPLAVPTKSARVLAFLALSRSSVSRADLASQLWPCAEVDRRLGNLRSALWRLPLSSRRAVRSTGDFLALDGEVECDIASLDSVPVDFDPPAFTPALCTDLLPGWYDDWVLAERERLELRQAVAFEDYSDRCRNAGRTCDSVLYAIAAIRIEPFRESAHRALMRAQAAQGNLAEMVEHFAELAETLREELGAMPSAETIAVLGENGIRVGDDGRCSLDV